MLRVAAVTSRRNVANQRSYVIIIIAQREGGAWEHMPQAVDRSEGGGRGDGAGWMERGLHPWLQRLGATRKRSRPDGQLSQHL